MTEAENSILRGFRRVFGQTVGESEIVAGPCPKCGSENMGDSCAIIQRRWWQLWKDKWTESAPEWRCCLDCDFEEVIGA